MLWRRSSPPKLYLLTDDIAIAPQPPEKDWPRIRALGFSGVVDLRTESGDIGSLVRSHELAYMRAPIVEHEAPTVDELYEITGWVKSRILERGPVLVYCREGRGRSATVAVACLVSLGLPLSEANSLLMRARPVAVINTKQMQALEAFASSLQATKAA